MHRIALALLALSLAACTAEPPEPPPPTARQTYERFLAAQIAKDGGTCFDLMSPTARTYVQELAYRLRERRDRPDPERKQLEQGMMFHFSKQELAELDGRSLLIKIVENMPNSFVAQGKQLTIIRVEEKGDAAKVHIRDGKGKEGPISLVRIDGIWRIDEGWGSKSR